MTTSYTNKMASIVEKLISLAEVLIIIYVIIIVVPIVLARGPHHPRGEKISKQHVHYRPTKGGSDENILHDVQLLHDTEHIQEHLDFDIDLSTLTDEEIEFYYFQVHDTDKNNKLDGLEMLQGILHTKHGFGHDHDDVTRGSNKEEYGLDMVNEENDIFDEFDQKHDNKDDIEFFTELIDKVMAMDDTNNDGFLSYSEYVEGRTRNVSTDNTFDRKQVLLVKK